MINNLNIKTSNPGGEIFIEDSILFFIFPFNAKLYLSLDIHQRINLKDSFFIPVNKFKYLHFN